MGWMPCLGETFWFIGGGQSEAGDTEHTEAVLLTGSAYETPCIFRSERGCTWLTCEVALVINTLIIFKFTISVALLYVLSISLSVSYVLLSRRKPRNTFFKSEVVEIGEELVD